MTKPILAIIMTIGVCLLAIIADYFLKRASDCESPFTCPLYLHLNASDSIGVVMAVGSMFLLVRFA
jgi:hypothetical protein